MDDQPLSAHRERSTFSARFSNRLHRYKNLLRTRWWLLLLGVALGTGIELFLLWHTPPIFMSAGRMIVSAKLSLPNANVYTEELNNFFGTQAALMQSSSVLNRVQLRLQSLKPDLHAVPVLLQVTISPKTSIFNLRATGSEPAYIQAYLDGIMVEYVELKKEMLRHASDSTKSGLQESLLSLGLELQKGKQDLVNYQASNSVVFLQDQGFSAGNYLAYLTKQIADLKSELNLLRMLTLDENVERLQSLSQQTSPQRNLAQSPASPLNSTEAPKSGGARAAGPGEADPSDRNNSSLVGSESEYLKAKQQILLLKAQRDELSEFLRPKHPKIIALNEDIDHKDKLLDIFRTQTQDQLKNREHSLELQIQNLEGELKVWEVKTLEISKKMSDYREIKEKNQRLQAMYDTLLTSENSVDVQKDISPESVTILEPAFPALAVPPEAFKHLSIAGLLGLALGIGALLWLDRLDDRPTSFTELEEVFDETVLGQIPLAAAKSKKESVPVIQADDDRHALVESYRNLRSSLVFMAAPKAHPKTLVLTSAIPGDGKSMTSANLAITLARSGSKVLLVDADLRRGLLHKQFAISPKPGFAEVLAEQCVWSAATVQTSVPNLSVLPRGAIPRHPGELFMTPAKEKFIQEVQGLYDFILFDTPPVMAADDVSNLAPYVDGVIMVIRANYTSGRVARAALDLLYLRKINVLGLVFNGVRPSASEYYYYKYKEYYASYPAE
ncbi:MAG: Tyrosine-protein kinase YwqD [Pedosphaera sp.]|nr:Tyrosine-protein kinase YwqD [Pedosphaera sp.]